MMAERLGIDQMADPEIRIAIGFVEIADGTARRDIESCSCDYICLCTPANFTGLQSKGDCQGALAFHIEDGESDGVSLSGLNFIVVFRAPGPRMIDGNAAIGVITDERASSDQQRHLVAIATGETGSPMVGLQPFITKFLGTTSAAIEFQGSGLSWSFFVPGLVDQAVEGLPSPVREGEPLMIDNTPLDLRIRFRSRWSLQHDDESYWDFAYHAGSINVFSLISRRQCGHPAGVSKR
jgi:hypothetical protein